MFAENQKNVLRVRMDLANLLLRVLASAAIAHVHPCPLVTVQLQVVCGSHTLALSGEPY